MNEASERGSASRNELEQALSATTKRMQRLLRQLRDAELDETASNEVKRSRRQMRANRELLGIASSPGSRAEQPGAAPSRPGGRQQQGTEE